MLDVVIAMAVIALLMLLILPDLPHRTTPSKLGAYVEEVAALLKQDRSAAARSGVETATRIDIADRRIESGDGRRALTLPSDVTLDVTASDLCRDRSGHVAIVFTVNGSSCGAVLSLAKGDLAWRIRVNWLSGDIDVVAPPRG